MFCWYLCDSLKLDYSKEKIFQYALAHDLVEAYAGDTFFFDNGARETKNGREESARVRMRNEFPEFADLHKTIEAYEHQNDSESRFVHAVDKLLPLLINYIQGGHTQKEMGVLRQEVYENKREKIGEQKEVRALLEQLIVLFEGDWEKYFVG